MIQEPSDKHPQLTNNRGALWIHIAQMSRMHGYQVRIDQGSSSIFQQFSVLSFFMFANSILMLISLMVARWV
jgi:hypothetical protein